MVVEVLTSTVEGGVIIRWWQGNCCTGMPLAWWLDVKYFGGSTHVCMFCTKCTNMEMWCVGVSFWHFLTGSFSHFSVSWGSLHVCVLKSWHSLVIIAHELMCCSWNGKIFPLNCFFWVDLSFSRFNFMTLNKCCIWKFTPKITVVCLVALPFLEFILKNLKYKNLATSI